MTDEELKKLESESKEQDEFVFMREEIKSRPINRKKLMRNTVVAAISAVVFGLVACVTFALLAPFVIDRLSDKEKEEEEEKVNPIVISFPEDTEEEEMAPEDMLVTSVEPAPEPVETPTLDEEEIKALISDVKLGLADYQEMYKSLSDVAVAAQRFLVRVTPVKDSTDSCADERSLARIVRRFPQKAQHPRVSLGHRSVAEACLAERTARPSGGIPPPPKCRAFRRW